jgi:hypothetical protein
VFLTHAGDVFARGLQVGWAGDNSIPRLDATVIQDFGLSPKKVGALASHIADELNKAKDFFDMIEG